MCKRRPPKISTFVVVFYPFWRRSHYQTSGSNRQGAVTLCERPGRTWLDANTEALKTCTTSVWHRIKTMRQIMPAAQHRHTPAARRAESWGGNADDRRWSVWRLVRRPTGEAADRQPPKSKLLIRFSLFQFSSANVSTSSQRPPPRPSSFYQPRSSNRGSASKRHCLQSQTIRNLA